MNSRWPMPAQSLDRMALGRRLTRILEDWNSLSDEPSDLIVRREYRSFVHYIGLYPNVNRSGLVSSSLRVAVMLSLLFLHWCGLVVSTVVLYDINFIYFSSSLHYVFVVGISFIYLLLFNLRRKFLSRYHSRIYFNFYDYREPISGEVRALQEGSDRQKRRLVVLPMGAASAAVSILLLAPILDKYGTFDSSGITAVNFNLPLPMLYFFDTFTVVGYAVALFHQLVSAMMCGLMFGGAGYMYMVMVTSLMTQQKILIYKLDTIEARAIALYSKKYGSVPTGTDYEMYKDEKFAKCMNICLRRCVEHHKVILCNFEELNDFSSVQLFCIFFVGALIIALAMLGASFWKILPGNTIASLVLCSTEVAFIGTLSSLGQSVTDLNEDLRIAIYNVKWYHCNKPFCQNIRILLVKTLEPLTFTACGLIKISYDTYANIINTAYSYYNIVIATGN